MLPYDQDRQWGYGSIEDIIQLMVTKTKCSALTLQGREGHSRCTVAL